jgi:hypothetical protein
VNALRGRRLLIVSVVVIAVATLTPGGGGDSSDMCILCGSRGLSDFLSNVLLFAPLGFALSRRDQSPLRALVIAATFSLGIEVAQLGLIQGRDSNIGDLLANTLGGILGWRFGNSRDWWQRNASDLKRCIAVTAATLVMLLTGLALFTPSLPDSTWYMQWTARFRSMAAYDGRLSSVRLGPLALPAAQIIERRDSVQRLMFTAPLEITGTHVLPRGMAPIASIADDRQRQMMMLGADRADLIYRYRMIADDLRLDHGDVRVHQAFEHVADGAPYRLRWTIDAKRWCLDLQGRSECGRGFSVGDTWTLLMSLDWGTNERAVLRTVWLWLMFVPAGLLAGRLRILMAAGALTAGALAAGPLLMGFAPTPPYQIVAAAFGLASGQLFMRARVSDMGRKR